VTEETFKVNLPAHSKAPSTPATMSKQHVECYTTQTILSTKSKQTEHVQFVSTLSKGRNFVRHCCLFWQQSRTLLRHCCWCGRGLSVPSIVQSTPLWKDWQAIFLGIRLLTHQKQILILYHLIILS